jgi:hypothetical protein
MDLLYLIVVPQGRGFWQHNYSTTTRQAGHANELSIYFLMSMIEINKNEMVEGIDLKEELDAS